MFSKADPFSPRRSVPATRFFLPFGTSNVKWLESKWKHGGADSLHQRLGANADIEGGDIVLELEPGGSHLEDETAKPTTLDVDDH